MDEGAVTVSLYDWERDPGVRWLSPTDDGYSIDKIDFAEAWCPVCRSTTGCPGHPNPPKEVTTMPLDPDYELGGMAPTSDASDASDAADDAVVTTALEAVKAAQHRTPFEEDLLVLGLAAKLDPEPNSAEDGLDLLRAVRFAEERLAQVKRDTLAFLADVLPKGVHEIEGYGPVDVSNSVSYSQWDHDALKSKLIRLIAGTQALGGDIDTVQEVIDRWVLYTGKPGRYSVSMLRAAGIEPDEYAAVRWTPSVRVLKDSGKH